MSKNLVRFDLAMKRLLRSKANFGILEGFLSELLKKDVKIMHLLESESNKRDQDNKQNRVDIMVQLDEKEIVLIEVQVNNEYDYFYRMLFGTSTIVAEYLDQGEAYSHVKKVYSVNILYFDLGHGDDYIYHGTTKFIGMHQHDELNLSDKQKELYEKELVHQIYPEYYLIKVNQFNDIAKNTLDEWIYFLKNEEIKSSFKAKGLYEAKEKLSELKLTENEKLDYKKYLHDLHYQASMVESNYDSGLLDGKKLGLDEGKKIGLDEGKRLGLDEGKKIGLEKGRVQEKLAIARNMKDVGMSVELIQKTTGLTADEIKAV